MFRYGLSDNPPKQRVLSCQFRSLFRLRFLGPEIRDNSLRQKVSRQDEGWVFPLNRKNSHFLEADFCGKRGFLPPIFRDNPLPPWSLSIPTFYVLLGMYVLEAVFILLLAAALSPTIL